LEVVRVGRLADVAGGVACLSVGADGDASGTVAAAEEAAEAPDTSIEEVGFCPSTSGPRKSFIVGISIPCLLGLGYGFPDN